MEAQDMNQSTRRDHACPSCKNDDLDYQRQAAVDVDRQGKPVVERDAIVFVTKTIDVSCPMCGEQFTWALP